MERPSFGATRPATNGQPTPAAASNDTDLGQVYKRLRQEYDRLNENRVKRSVMLQNATDEDDRCRREAEAFGASSPEELEQILAKRREEAAQELANFEAALVKEAELQAQVEQDLAAAEKR